MRAVWVSPHERAVALFLLYRGKLSLGLRHFYIRADPEPTDPPDGLVFFLRN